MRVDLMIFCLESLSKFSISKNAVRLDKPALDESMKLAKLTLGSDFCHGISPTQKVFQRGVYNETMAFRKLSNVALTSVGRAKFLLLGRKRMYG